MAQIARSTCPRHGRTNRRYAGDRRAALANLGWALALARATKPRNRKIKDTAARLRINFFFRKWASGR